MCAVVGCAGEYHLAGGVVELCAVEYAALARQCCCGWMEDLAPQVLPHRHGRRVCVVVSSRAHVWRSELLYLVMLDRAQQQDRESGLWDVDGLGRESDYL